MLRFVLWINSMSACPIHTYQINKWSLLVDFFFNYLYARILSVLLLHFVYIHCGNVAQRRGIDAEMWAITKHIIKPDFYIVLLISLCIPIRMKHYFIHESPCNTARGFNMLGHTGQVWPCYLPPMIDE